MIKIKAFVYMAILMLALTGCGKEEPEQLTVYSFSGEKFRDSRICPKYWMLAGFCPNSL